MSSRNTGKKGLAIAMLILLIGKLCCASRAVHQFLISGEPSMTTTRRRGTARYKSEVESANMVLC